MQTGDVVDLARRSVGVARDADLGMLSAAVAYYGLVSVFPLALLAIVVATRLGAGVEGVRAALTAGAAPSLRPLVAGALDAGVATQGTATAVGLVLLGWSASRVFAGIDRALRQIHGVGRRWGRLARPAAAAVVLGSVAAVVVALTAVSVGFAFVEPPWEDAVKTTVSVAAVAAGLMPIYAVLSSREVGFAGAVPGAAVAAVGLAALRAGFEFYVARSGAADLYGIVGGVLLFALWLYLGAVVVLFGACVNQAVADAAGVT